MSEKIHFFDARLFYFFTFWTFFNRVAPNFSPKQGKNDLRDQKDKWFLRNWHFFDVRKMHLGWKTRKKHVLCKKVVKNAFFCKIMCTHSFCTVFGQWYCGSRFNFFHFFHFDRFFVKNEKSWNESHKLANSHFDYL